MKELAESKETIDKSDYFFELPKISKKKPSPFFLNNRYKEGFKTERYEAIRESIDPKTEPAPLVKNNPLSKS